MSGALFLRNEVCETANSPGRRVLLAHAARRIDLLLLLLLDLTDEREGRVDAFDFEFCNLSERITKVSFPCSFAL